jgi:hypothetical protein
MPLYEPALINHRMAGPEVQGHLELVFYLVQFLVGDFDLLYSKAFLL